MPIKFTEEEERIIMGKTLVDANKIGKVKPCCEPVDGDLVRIEIAGIELIAVFCHYSGNRSPYYVSQDGSIHACGGVKVLEIIGKCVFSVYV